MITSKHKIQLDLWRTAGKKIVFTNGCFDILHYGHVRYLTDSRQEGDVLVIGLNSDASVRRLKGDTRPINPLTHRRAILEALRVVDMVIPFEQDTPEALIRIIKPDVLTKGSDYTLSEIIGANFVTSYGGVVRRIELIHGISTSNILNKAKD